VNWLELQLALYSASISAAYFSAIGLRFSFIVGVNSSSPGPCWPSGDRRQAPANAGTAASAAQSGRDQVVSTGASKSSKASVSEALARTLARRRNRQFSRLLSRFVRDRCWDRE
jgi:hypothetical protein